MSAYQSEMAMVAEQYRKERDEALAKAEVLKVALLEISRESELDHNGDRWRTRAAARALKALAEWKCAEPPTSD